MYKIVHTPDCANSASKLAEKLGECELFDINDLISEPESLGDFTELGLVFPKDGKAVPTEVVTFIRNVLGSYDLKSLEYLFSFCVCDDGPKHALKVVEKLCSKIGCAPSLSLTMPADGPSEVYEDLAKRVVAGDIQLAKGSLGTMFFMKFAMKI